MNALKSLHEAQVGQRLSFSYYGGEHPGTTREVDVLEVRDDRIVGTDVDKQETRQYLFDKAAIIRVITPIAKVDALVADLDDSYLDDNQPVAAEEVQSPPTTRVRSTRISFPEARRLLHQQIDTLDGEDLAEVLAEVQGEDRSLFDADNGAVVLEKDILVPHCEVNDHAHRDAAGIDWVNEDGVRLTTTFLHDGSRVVLYQGNDDNEITAENLITAIAQHLGLTIS
jgi:hypothetical protein